MVSIKWSWVVFAGLGIGCIPDGSGQGPPSDPSGTMSSDEGGTLATGATMADSASATIGSEDGPASTHTVGGTLEGLQGATVSIVNGADVLVLDADGPFVFPSQLSDGELYAVQVDGQPSGPDQTCTVDAGEGTVAGGDVVDVQVRCVTPIRHVVVLGIDGLGGDWFEPVNTPHLDALREESSWTLQMQNALPTSSSTNWMSMIGGAGPQQHGVLSNGWQPGESDPPPTMFAALREHQPDAVIGVFHDWNDFDRLVEPGVVDHIEHPGDELDTMDAATAWLGEELPTLLFVHLDHVDYAGHNDSWGSGAYMEAVEGADELWGELRMELTDAGMWPYTAVLVSSDHGGSGSSHGADTAAERTIPFLLRTPQGATGPVERDLRIWDVAATVLALLDVPAPDEWIASPVVEGLYASPWQLPPPVGQIEVVPVTEATQLYDETGTGAADEVSIWRPVTPAGYALLGDMAMPSHDAPTEPAFAMLDDPLALAPPVGFELIWQDVGSGGDTEVSVWNPIPPLGYVCMGAVAVVGYTAPQIEELRCVHGELVQRGLSNKTWNDAGSGADWDGALWACLAGGDADPGAMGLEVGTFVARRHANDAGIDRCHTLRARQVTVAR